MDTGSVFWMVTTSGASLALLLLVLRNRASHGEPREDSRHEHMEPFVRREDPPGVGPRPVRIPVRTDDDDGRSRNVRRRR